MYHYVYRITNTLLKKHYYGKRSSKLPPREDLGIYYFSSSKDENFRKDQLANPAHYKYKIVKICESAEKAIAFEIILHNKFDVGKNPNFYNRAKQTSTKFVISDYASMRSVEVRKGVPLSNAHKKSISQGMKGKNTENHKKFVNIYCYKTDKLLESNVCITDWCRIHTNYSQGTLVQTAQADRTKPSSATNRLHHKQIYAQYIN